MYNLIIDFDADWSQFRLAVRGFFISDLSASIWWYFFPDQTKFVFELLISGPLKMKFLEFQEKIQKSEQNILTTLYLSTLVEKRSYSENPSKKVSV